MLDDEKNGLLSNMGFKSQLSTESAEYVEGVDGETIGRDEEDERRGVAKLPGDGEWGGRDGGGAGERGSNVPVLAEVRERRGDPMTDIFDSDLFLFTFLVSTRVVCFGEGGCEGERESDTEGNSDHSVGSLRLRDIVADDKEDEEEEGEEDADSDADSLPA